MPEKKRRKLGKISLVSFAKSHPLNVKPSGNLLLDDKKSVHQRKKAQLMGDFSKFSDELLMEIFSYIRDATTLRNLSHTSRVMYAYLYDEDLCKKIYLQNQIDLDQDLRWRGSWRATILNIDELNEAKVKVSDNLVCSDTIYRPFQLLQVNYAEVFAALIHDEEVRRNSPREFHSQRVPLHDESQLEFTPNSPFIITASKGRWPQWDIDYLLSRFSDVKFRQETVQWTLKTYVEYLRRNKDESPLYLFDCQSVAMEQLKKEYASPEVFNQDLFKVLEEGKLPCRPDHAWLIVGPARSGSTFHKDPNCTSAWNTSLSGRKLWVMFPANVVPPGVMVTDDESEVTSPVGLAEWVFSGFFNDCLLFEDCQISITFPGECMYVPAGWWHLVINIDESVALTENFVPLPNLQGTLEFFKTKAAQISGFRPRQVRDAIASSVNWDDEQDTELKDYIRAYDRLQLDSNFEDEDCGELKLDLNMPIFEYFVKLLKILGYSVDETLAAIEAKQKKSSWKEPTSFKFGFEVD